MYFLLLINLHLTYRRWRSTKDSLLEYIISTWIIGQISFCNFCEDIAKFFFKDFLMCID